MRRNPLKKLLALSALVLGTLLIAPPQQEAEAGWRRAYRWGTPYYGGRYYSTWRAPSYGGYYYAAPQYYYTPPVYYSSPSYYYGYGGYPSYGYSSSYYYGPGFGYYRTGYRGGWGISIGF